MSAEALGVLAYSVAVLHGGVVAWVFFGGFIARRSGRLIAVQLFCAAWGLFTTITPFPCPLTWLEDAFRAGGGLQPYAGDCIVHYLWHPLSLPTGPFVPYAVLAVAALFNLTAYWPLLRASKRRSSVA